MIIVTYNTGHEVQQLPLGLSSSVNTHHKGCIHPWLNGNEVL